MQLNKKQKAVIIFSVIILLGGLLVFIRQPKKKTSTIEDAMKRYTLPETFNAADIQIMVEKMRKDAEFKFYFKILSRQQRIKPISEASEIILAQQNSSVDLLKEIKEQYKAIRGLGSAFYLLEFPRKFIERPSNYPQFEKIMINFVSQEFKLAIIGVYYKVHHDPYFMFQWDSTSIMAARKLRNMWDEHMDYVGEQQLGNK